MAPFWWANMSSSPGVLRSLSSALRRSAATERAACAHAEVAQFMSYRKEMVAQNG